MEKLDAYLRGLRSPATQGLYSRTLRKVFPDADAFLKLTREEAEAKLTDYIISRRESVAAYTLATEMRIVKSFCDEYGFVLNWKQLKKKIPRSRTVAADRGPTIEEIRRGLGEADFRERTVFLMLASSGMRIGAFEGMLLRGISFRESGIARVSVYPGEAEQYSAFISPEAVAALTAYIELRRKDGETIDATSPVIRDLWDRENGRVPSRPAPLAVGSIKHVISRMWLRSGVRTKIPGRHAGQSEFKGAHGFRKFFRTQAIKGTSKPEYVEVLMGHVQPYFKPSLDELESEYLKAVPFLTISEAEQVKTELKETEKKHDSEWQRVRLENLELKQSLRELSEKVDREIAKRTPPEHL